MKQTKSRKLNKDAGFSLVELLIAVTILAIIVIPLLHLFLTSTKINVKSRQTLRATTVAQDIMEGLKAYDIDELKAQFNNPIEGFYVINDQLVKGGVSEDFDREESQNGLDAEGNINPGLYYFTMEGVSMQGSEYDALIEVDARGYMESPSGSPASGHDQKFNSTGFAKLPGIDVGSAGSGSGKDAVYTQDATLTTRMLKKINEHFYYNLDGGTDPDWDWEESGWFTEESIKSGGGVDVSRYITIDLTDSHTSDEDGNPIINAAVTYEYEFVRGGEPPCLLYGEDMYGQEINTSSFANFTSGRLYLFYYPLYGANDEIIINNNANIPLQIYIAKQIEGGDLGVADPTKETGTKLTDAQLMIAEKNYDSKVSIYGGNIYETEIMTNLHYNLADKKFLEGENPVSSQAPIMTFQFTDASGSSYYADDCKNHLKVFDLSGVGCDGYLSATNDEITEVIYDVKVSVYKEGAAAKGFADDKDRMIVIEGSKNN